MSKYTAEQVRACILAYKNGDLNYCRSGIIDLLTECAAILDAEGDGGAVIPTELFAWLTARDLVPDLDEDGSFDMHLLIEALNEHERQLQATHPARSGVVRDEDVEAACKIYVSNGGGSEVNNYVRVNMRAALEHFAKGERHER